MRWGTSDAVFRVSGGGDTGRDRGLKSENPLSFSFSFSLPLSVGFCADSAKCAADGETVGETASNLPSRSEEAELRLFDVSLSFLRGKTFEKKAAMVREKPGDLTSVVVSERRDRGRVKRVCESRRRRSR